MKGWRYDEGELKEKKSCLKLLKYDHSAIAGIESDTSGLPIQIDAQYAT